jgi:predicted metal-dependent HD superfamily phosphohydrolase
MFAVVEELCHPCPPGPALALAVWFHDAVYDPRAADNEEQSAAVAQRLLAPWVAPPVLAETARLILLTKRHETTPEDGPGHILLDADLAILGAGPAEYDCYAEAIRREYAWVPEADYRAGRKRVLERFLLRPRLYYTDRMRARAEAPARENLHGEVGRLGE